MYRCPAADYPNLRSSHGHYAYIGKYVEVGYVGRIHGRKQLVITAHGRMPGMGLRGSRSETLLLEKRMVSRVHLADPQKWIK